jgi:hypothetical protein
MILHPHPSTRPPFDPGDTPASPGVIRELPGASRGPQGPSWRWEQECCELASNRTKSRGLKRAYHTPIWTVSPHCWSAGDLEYPPWGAGAKEMGEMRLISVVGIALLLISVSGST